MAQRALRRATTSLSVIACCCRRLNPLRRQRNLADLRCQDQVSYPKLSIQVRMTPLRRGQGASGEGQPAQANAIYPIGLLLKLVTSCADCGILWRIMRRWRPLATKAR